MMNCLRTFVLLLFAKRQGYKMYLLHNVFSTFARIPVNTKNARARTHHCMCMNPRARIRPVHDS